MNLKELTKTFMMILGNLRKLRKPFDPYDFYKNNPALNWFYTNLPSFVVLTIRSTNASQTS